MGIAFPKGTKEEGEEKDPKKSSVFLHYPGGIYFLQSVGE